MPGFPALAPAGDLAHLVHDLHGPLTVIRGLCATLSRTEHRPDHRRALALIDGEAVRLAEGLRALSRPRPEGGPASLPVDLAALARSAAERFGPAALQAGSRLSLRGVHRAVWVEADAAALERAVENLLTNALRHSGMAEVSVILRYGVADVEIEVVDDGRPPSSATEGFGLIGMRERVGLYGGSLQAGPRAGGGYAVLASVPR